MERRAHLVAEILADCRPRTLLDVGAGDGRVSLPFACPGSKVTLVEISATMVAAARKNVREEQEPYVDFVVQDLITLSESKQFDVLLCLGVLAHVADVPLCLQKISRLVAAGGIAILQLTDGSTLLGGLEYLATVRGRRNRGYSFNRLSSRMVTNHLQALGLSLANERRYFSFTTGRRGGGKGPNDVLWKAVSKISEPFGGERLLVYRKGEAS